MPRRLRASIIDFDYILADSSAGAIECVNHALRGLGLSPAEPQSIRATIGLPLPVVFHRLGGSGNPGKTRDFTRLFTARADEVMSDRTTLLPNVPSSIRRLSENHLSLGIASTKYRYRIEEILRRENLPGFISALAGGEDVEQHKPDPAGLRAVIGTLRRNPAEVPYVGDNSFDAEATQRCGVPFAAVLSGVAVEADFAGFPVMKFAGNMAGMTDWILE